MKVVDYFAGSGGFTLGAEAAGCTVVEAINHWPLAVETHATNHPTTIHRCEDLTRFNPRRLADFDGLVASPACQGHSPARGVATGADGDARWDDSRATAWSVIDCAEVRRPRWIVVENVVAFQRWTLLPSWLDALKRLGYGLCLQTLDSAAWGVPQSRPRTIVTAVRGRRAPRVEVPIVDPSPIGDVIAWGEGAWSLVQDRVEATRVKIARGRRELGDRFVLPYNGATQTGRSIARPIGTITAADRWAVVDGDRMRMLSVDEIRAAMGFPANYKLPPQREHATKLLGNAVVPAVAEAAVRACVEAAS